MRKAARLLAILALGLIIFGCNRQGSNNPETASDQGLALKFLQGIQQGDKKIMYEATNLSEDLINSSREQLINKAKNDKLTEQQRTEHQFALRISGQIDFFLKKTRPMFPKSASFAVVKTTGKSASGGRQSVHRVKITYTDKAEAIRDKTGKQVKEMVVNLQQMTRPVGGRPVNELSFETKDFEKMADRDFEVSSYY